jgi:hypothetical protein
MVDGREQGHTSSSGISKTPYTSTTKRRLQVVCVVVCPSRDIISRVEAILDLSEVSRLVAFFTARYRPRLKSEAFSVLFANRLGILLP